MRTRMRIRKTIEPLGTIRCKWSGFKVLRCKEFEEIVNNYYYGDAALVLGFFVVRWRVWIYIEVVS